MHWMFSLRRNETTCNVSTSRAHVAIAIFTARLTLSVPLAPFFVVNITTTLFLPAGAAEKKIVGIQLEFELAAQFSLATDVCACVFRMPGIARPAPAVAVAAEQSRAPVIGQDIHAARAWLG